MCIKHRERINVDLQCRRVRVLRFIKLTFKPENALFITSFLRTVLERNLVELAEILISTYLQRNGIML